MVLVFDKCSMYILKIIFGWMVDKLLDSGRYWWCPQNSDFFGHIHNRQYIEKVTSNRDWSIMPIAEASHGVEKKHKNFRIIVHYMDAVQCYGAQF